MYESGMCARHQGLVVAGAGAAGKLFKMSSVVWSLTATYSGRVGMMLATSADKCARDTPFLETPAPTVGTAPSGYPMEFSG